MPPRPDGATGESGEALPSLEVSREARTGLVSCIVPVFNGERYLAETLDSVLQQTYRPLEILVCDDGSTDGSADIAAGYGDPVRYLRQSNAGSTSARNLGLAAARGEFVAFLDADDLWHPEKLARQVVLFDSWPELEVCATYLQSFWIPELRDEESRFQDHPLSRSQPGFVASTLLARHRIFEALGPFDTGWEHSSVTEWLVRAQDRGAVIHLLPDVLVYRRLHRANYSRLLAPQSREEHLLLVKSILDRRRRAGRAG
jgi:glycosyltransferase involved in cell wall biosynthesis